MWSPFVSKSGHESLKPLRETHCYPRLAEKESSQEYVELPLEQLKKMFTTPAEIKFLEEQVVASCRLKLSVGACFDSRYVQCAKNSVESLIHRSFVL